jgi:Helix-loop-helix DNA-binding domain
MEFANFAESYEEVSGKYPMTGSDFASYIPTELQHKRQRRSLDGLNLGFGNEVSRNAFAKAEYEEHSPGHSLLGSPIGDIGAVNPVHIFGGLPTPYLMSPDIDIDHGAATFQTPLSTPGLISRSESLSDYFGCVNGESMPIDEESPMESTEQAQSASSGAPIRKKRGRPKLEKPKDGDSGDGRRQQRTRMPHNEVERKYRESLNQGFEKLRTAIPSLPENNPETGATAQKQSKAVVLGAAIDYIKHLEAEVERFKEENESLRGIPGEGGSKFKKGGGSNKHGSKRVAGA